MIDLDVIIYSCPQINSQIRLTLRHILFQFDSTKFTHIYQGYNSGKKHNHMHFTKTKSLCFIRASMIYAIDGSSVHKSALAQLTAWSHFW